MLPRLLIVEDDETMVRTLSKFFSSSFKVATACDGEQALNAVWEAKPDVIVLDITMPGMDGFEVCRRLRNLGFSMPILFLTAKETEPDLIAGFAAGGDDYITKPASLKELDARVRAALRRGGTQTAVEQDFSFANVSVDFRARRVTVNGIEVQLATKEFDLLQFMIRHRGKALTRQEILENVWDYASGVPSRTLDTHVLNLRRKLCDSEDGAHCIQTVYGVGYRFIS